MYQRTAAPAPEPTQAPEAEAENVEQNSDDIVDVEFEDN